jgi:hypothetical protein
MSIRHILVGVFISLLLVHYYMQLGYSVSLDTCISCTMTILKRRGVAENVFFLQRKLTDFVCYWKGDGLSPMHSYKKGWQSAARV